jgi:hypothetical protein
VGEAEEQSLLHRKLEVLKALALLGERMDYLDAAEKKLEGTATTLVRDTCVPDVMHCENRVSEKLITLVVQAIIDNPKETKVVKQRRVDAVLRVINEECLCGKTKDGEFGDPTNHTINIVKNKVCLLFLYSLCVCLTTPHFLSICHV